MRRAVLVAAAVILAAVWAACGIDLVGTASLERGDREAGPGATDPDSSGRDPNLELDGGDASPQLDGTTDSGPPPPRAIYVAATNSLWKLDPISLQFTRLDDFVDCPGDIGELAVDGRGVIVATRRDNTRLWKVSAGASNIACTAIGNGQYPMALTFAPKGTADPNDEVLVGFNDAGSYGKVDLANGGFTLLGAQGIAPYRPNGDLVTAGDRGYVAAQGPGCNGCLVEFDPTTGAFVANVGEIGASDIYGLAHWGGRLFAFSNGSGKTFVITPAPFSVEELAPPPATGDVLWFGAGSSSRAPTQ